MNYLSNKIKPGRLQRHEEDQVRVIELEERSKKRGSGATKEYHDISLDAIEGTFKSRTIEATEISSGQASSINHKQHFGLSIHGQDLLAEVHENSKMVVLWNTIYFLTIISFMLKLLLRKYKYSDISFAS